MALNRMPEDLLSTVSALLSMPRNLICIATSAFTDVEALLGERQEAENEIAALKLEIDDYRRTLLPTPKALIQVGDAKKDSSDYLKLDDPDNDRALYYLRKVGPNERHAGHDNNLGCAYLLRPSMNTATAQTWFDKAINNKNDFPLQAPNEPPGQLSNPLNLPRSKIVSDLDSVGTGEPVVVYIVPATGPITSFNAQLSKSVAQVRIQPYDTGQQVAQWTAALRNAEKIHLLPYPSSAKQQAKGNLVLLEAIKTAEQKREEKKEQASSLIAKIKRLVNPGF